MIRVIGIGSPFGDDRAAWAVIAGLETSKRDGLDLLTLNQPGASLINWFNGVDHLILVDTLLSPDTAAPFLKIQLEELESDHERLSSHGQQLLETLALAAALNCLPTPTEIYAVLVPGVDTDALSPAATRAANALAGHLASRIRAPESKASPGERLENRGP